jgi:hypothetical protein
VLTNRKKAIAKEIANQKYDEANIGDGMQFRPGADLQKHNNKTCSNKLAITRRRY